MNTEDERKNWNEGGQDLWLERKDDKQIGEEQYRQKKKVEESLGHDTWRDKPKWVLLPGNPD